MVGERYRSPRCVFAARWFACAAAVLAVLIILVVTLRANSASQTTSRPHTPQSRTQIHQVPQLAQQPAAVAPTAISPYRTVITRYCVSCHNERLKTGGLVLTALDPDNVGSDVELWEKV